MNLQTLALPTCDSTVVAVCLWIPAGCCGNERLSLVYKRPCYTYGLGLILFLFLFFLFLPV